MSGLASQQHCTTRRISCNNLHEYHAPVTVDSIQHRRSATRQNMQDLLRFAMQLELREYRSSHQRDITDAVSAMDTYTYQADVQQDKLDAVEGELQRTVLVLQGVVDICNQTQAELSDAMQAKQELEHQAQQQNGHLQEALSFIRDLLRDKGVQIPAQVLLPQLLNASSATGLAPCKCSLACLQMQSGSAWALQ